MYKFLIKYHKVILTLIKILISLLAVYYLWRHEYLQNLWEDKKELQSVKFVSELLIFSLINWLLEIKKWQLLAGYIHPTSYKEAARQSLVSFALSLLTPNRVGEYGVKVLYYQKKDYKKVIGLSLIGNISQLIVTLLAGMFGLWYVFRGGKMIKIFNHNFLTHPGWQIWLLLIAVLFIIAIMFYIQKKYEKNLIFHPDLWKKSIFYALLRYVVFSTQFVWLLMYFKVDNNLLILYVAVSLVYLFAVFVPMLSLLDWAVKGNIAIWVFSSLGIDGVPVIKIVALMWIGNFLLPFLTGLIWMWASKTIVR